MKKIFALVLALVMLMTLVGCTYAQSSHTKLSDQQEATQQKFADRDLPSPDNSQDWDNVERRINFLNRPENQGYIYLISAVGIIAEIPVRGKVTSLNTYITPMEMPIVYGSSIMVAAPDLDGTYGENVNGVFWFDAQGEYHEYNGEYYFSSRRMTFTETPLLIENDY